MNENTEKNSFYDSAMSDFGPRRRTHIGLRMTPMVDIIFLLLTFFVLTAKFQDVEKTVRIFIPKGPVSPAVEQESLIISLKSDSEASWIQVQSRPPMSINSESFDGTLLNLAGFLQDICQNTAYSAVEINCDDEISWDQVVKIYDVIYACGLDNITFRYHE